MSDSVRRVLVIEDDGGTAREISDPLAKGGYAVDCVELEEQGFARGSAESYVAIIVGHRPPILDGIELIRRLREAGVATPVLIVSALGAVDDRVRGLRAGSDDYLVEPFAPPEMLARTDALARRSDSVFKETILRVADLELDLLARSARRAGRNLELLPKEFQLLEYLVRHEGLVVPRAMLLAHVWDLHFDPATNIIDVYMGRLRRKVDFPDAAYPLIRTVRRLGFVLRATQ